MTHLSLIIPTYNEAANIQPLLENVSRLLSGIPYEIIVVDDNSPDQTGNKVRAISQNNPHIRLIQRENQRGLASAVIQGFEAAAGDVLGVMDGDGSHDETILRPMITAIDEGYELVVGSRRVPGGGSDHWPWYRRLSSTIATQVARRLLALPLRDPMSGYFLLQRALYDRSKTKLYAGGYKILLEIYCQSLPRRVQEIPYIFKDRKQGQSKASLSVLGHYFLSLMHLKRVKNKK